MKDLNETRNWIQFNNNAQVENSDLGKRWIKYISNHISNNMSEEEPIDMSGKYEGFFDGSAKPNPGLIKIGGFIKDPNGKVIVKYSEATGNGTNNEAEYISFIRLVNAVIDRGIKNITIYGDSALVVNQVNHTWKARDERMKNFKSLALEQLKQIPKWRLEHIKRGFNTEADSLTR